MIRGATGINSNVGAGCVAHSCGVSRYAPCACREASAEVAHHVKHHEGDWTAFVNGKLESLCAPCHAEIHGRLKVPIGADGWPPPGTRVGGTDPVP